MLPDPSLTIAKRPEPDLERSWGIYSAQKDRWLDVVFQSEREALESLRVLLSDPRDKAPR